MFMNVVKNNNEEVDIWGTEDVPRGFLYMKDMTKVILLATERYNKPEPVNGEITWGFAKPDGQPRKSLGTRLK